MEEKRHFKMYKAGKMWVYAAIIMLSTIASGIVFDSGAIHAADTVSSASNRSVSNGEVDIDGSEIDKHFDLIQNPDNEKNGDFKYDAANKELQLTGKNQWEVGKAILKNVTVNFAHNFSFNGSVYLGDGTQHPGADGIAFFFHDGSNTDQGFNGNGFGIGSLTKAFGFKFDTFTNNDDSPFYEPDPKSFAKGPFGSFVYNNPQGKVLNYLTSQTSTANPQYIGEPDNQFHDVAINYDATTKMLTVTANMTSKLQTWSININEFKKIEPDLNLNANYVFGISSSTGGSYNLQKVKVNDIKFTGTSTADVQFVDDKGNLIPGVTGANFSGEVGKTVDIDNDTNIQSQLKGLQHQGWVLQKITASDPENYQNGVVTYSALGNTITYHLSNKQRQINTKSVKQIVRYVTLVDGKEVEVAPSYQTTYQAGQLNTVENGRVTHGPWTPARGSNLNPIVSPTITNFTADKLAVPAYTQWNSNATEVTTTVYYTQQNVNTIVRFVDQNGKQIKGDSHFRGVPGSISSSTPQSDIDNLVSRGYELVSSEFPANGDIFSTNGKIYTIVFKKGTKQGDVQTKQITRTINVYDPDNKLIETHHQNVDYALTQVLDAVTGKVLGYDTDGDGIVDTTDANQGWVSPNNKFAAYDSPAAKQTVPAQIVQYNDQDIVVNIHLKQPTPQPGPEPKPEPTPKPKPQPQPNRPVHPTPNTPQNHQPVTPNTPAKDNTAKQAKLPKTDQVKSNLLTFSGLIGVFMVIATIAFITKRKQKK